MRAHGADVIAPGHGLDLARRGEAGGEAGQRGGAGLDLLERTLAVTRHALIAANPELHACLDESPGGLPWDAQVYCANDLLNLADRIRGVLRTYRHLLAEAEVTSYGANDFPF